MRKIDQIIWHCSASPEGVDLKTEAIRGMHKNQNGWSDIGYHFVIEIDGSVHKGRSLLRPGAHVSGMNRNSIGVCYGGGVNKNMNPKDTRTSEQKQALYDLTERLLADYPNATVHGHNEFAAKACPSFDAQEDWSAYLASEERAPDTDRDPRLSPDITPGLHPKDMRDEDFATGWSAGEEPPDDC